jgi:hypothetical protein
MARPRTQIDLASVEAKFILEALYHDGRISRETLAEYRGRFTSEVETLEKRIAYLRGLAGGAIHAAANAVAAEIPRVMRAVRRGRAKAAAKLTARPKANAAAKSSGLSAERIATQKLQGVYLGLLSRVPANSKKRFGKDAIKLKGKDAVIAEMQTFLGQGGSSSKRKK